MSNSRSSPMAVEAGSGPATADPGNPGEVSLSGSAKDLWRTEVGGRNMRKRASRKMTRVSYHNYMAKTCPPKLKPNKERETTVKKTKGQEEISGLEASDDHDKGLGLFQTHTKVPSSPRGILWPSGKSGIGKSSVEMQMSALRLVQGRRTRAMTSTSSTRLLARFAS